MKSKLAIKIFLSSPLKIIKKGILSQYENYHKRQIQKKYNLTQLPSIEITDLIENLNDEINNYSFLSGTSLITDIILLKSLAKRFEDCIYLEIGSWRGESISNVAQVAKTCYSVSLSAEEMKQFNFSQDFIDVHGIFSKHQNNIISIGHNSLTFDFSTLNQKFDLIFVDGDHTFEGVLSDTKKVFPLRRDKKSIIVWHDYGFSTEETRYSVLNAILDGIPLDKHKNLFHVSNTLCAVYIENNNFSTFQNKFPSYPNKSFEIKVKALKL